MNRKDFLLLSKITAMGCAITGTPLRLFAANHHEGDNVLVMIHLKGGNDGLNTIIPLDQYDALATARENVILPHTKVLSLNTVTGLHPAMKEVKEMYDDGMVHIVQGVGHSHECISHSDAIAMWMNCGSAMATPLWENTKVIKGNSLAAQLHQVSEEIKEGTAAQVYIVTLDGFDTHVAQTDRKDTTQGLHAQLLQQLSVAVYDFLKTARKKGFADRVSLMAFSEFGRRIKSNIYGGTDHGTAGPVMMFGKNIKGGITGSNPALPAEVTVADNLAVQYDLRRIYAGLEINSGIQQLAYAGHEPLHLFTA